VQVYTAGVVTPPRAATERLGFLLKHAQQRFVALHQPALEPFDLDGRQLAVLALIGGEGPALQQRLAERLGVDRTSMVALVDQLEGKGFVVRRQDPTDRRGRHVEVTTKGRNTLARGLRASGDAERRFLTPLTAAERTQFRRLLRRLVEAEPGGP
jgi:DNA-binding MarR family transcriptional regulator